MKHVFIIDLAVPVPSWRPKFLNFGVFALAVQKDCNDDLHDLDNAPKDRNKGQLLTAGFCLNFC